MTRPSSGRRDAFLLAVTTLFLLCARPVAAYRPFDSTDAAVAEKGKCEVELGPVEFQRAGDTSLLLLPKAVVNLGVTRNWEIVLEGSHLRRLGDVEGEARSSLVDTGLFVKGVVREGSLQEKSGLSVAIEGGPLLPTVHGESGTGFSFAAICSNRWEGVTGHLNATVERTRAGNLALVGGLIVEGSERHPLRPVAELLVEHETGAESTVSALVGAIYRVADAFSVDAAVRAARIGGESAFEIRAGFTWAFSLAGK